MKIIEMQDTYINKIKEINKNRKDSRYARKIWIFQNRGFKKG